MTKLSNGLKFAREQLIKQEGKLIVPETVWGKVHADFCTLAVMPSRKFKVVWPIVWTIV